MRKKFYYHLFQLSLLLFNLLLILCTLSSYDLKAYAAVNGTQEIIALNVNKLNTGEVKNEKEQPLVLEEVSVTASRRRTPLKDSPAKVNVIKKEEIENSPSEKIEDLLQRIPDVNLMKSQRTECAAREITLRGVPDQSKTLVLVDGIPMNGPAHGWLSWSLIPNEAIEKIEIVHGPMSALYGSGAMGGVINIITKKIKKPHETIFKTSYGSMNTLYNSIFHGGLDKNFSYYIGGSVYSTDGYIAAKNQKAYNIKNARTDQNALAKFIWYSGDDSSLTLGFSHVNEDVDRGRTFINHQYITDMAYLTYSKESEKDDKILAVESSIYFKNQDWSVKFDKKPLYNALYQIEEHGLIDRGLTFKKSVSLDKKNVLTAGIDYKVSGLDMTDKFITGPARTGGARGGQSLFSIFAQDEIKTSGKATVTVGVRNDFCKSYGGMSFDTNPAPLQPFNNKYNDKNWTAFSPKAGITYHLDKLTTLRASIGKAFAAPNLMKLYTTMQRGLNMVYGNPALEPETAVSYEFDIDRSFNEKLSGKLSLYNTNSDNFVGLRTTSATAAVYDNITRVKIKGIDTELNYKISERWKNYIGYTYNKSVIENDKNDPATAGNYLPFVPKYKARIGFTYSGPNKISADLCMRYTGESYIDLKNTKADILGDYWTGDLMLSKEIRKNQKISIGVENIFNVKYDLYGIPDDKSAAPGRVVTLYTTYKF